MRTRRPAPKGTIPEQKRIGELEDALKDKGRRLDDLKAGHDKQAELITEMRDQLEECSAQITRWIEAFDMELGEDGWHWNRYVANNNTIADMLRERLQQWNRFVPKYNATIAPRNMGRPLQAGPGQVQKVLARHKTGQSIRSIAEDMELGVRTVRTIIDKKDHVDRATLKHLQRIAPDRAAEARARRMQRDQAALPRRITGNLKRNADLIRAAKGLR